MGSCKCLSSAEDAWTLVKYGLNIKLLGERDDDEKERTAIPYARLQRNNAVSGKDYAPSTLQQYDVFKAREKK